MQHFYIIGRLAHPWGDYGDSLVHGMAYRTKDDPLLQLERTGPYVPKVSLPGIGNVVVTDAFRRTLEQSDLRGLRFEPVNKRLIVLSDWHTWDATSDEPPEHPESGEPEDYVLGRQHSQQASDEMGDLWALVLSDDAVTRRPTRIVQHTHQITLVEASWRGQDIFAAQGVGFVYVTEAAKSWFEIHAPSSMTFEAATTVPT